MTIQELINALQDAVQNNPGLNYDSEVGVDIDTSYTKLGVLKQQCEIADIEHVVVMGDYGGTDKDGLRLCGVAN